MKKAKKIKKSSISKNEYALIEAIRKAGMEVFDIDMLEKIGFKKPRVYQLLYNMKRKGIISEIKGNYILTFLSKPDLLSVACKILYPSYVSFWTALSYYKFTEQLPRTIFLATTKAKRTIIFEKTKINFVKISPRRFFGYEKIDSVIIATKEKAIVDSLLLSRYAGGIEEIFKCLCNAWHELEKKILLDYAMRMKNKSLLKRLGYLIEKGNLKVNRKYIEKIRKNIGEGYSKLDPQKPREGSYDKRWNLLVNVHEKRLLAWRKIL